jgi:hypothetical protein
MTRKWLYNQRNNPEKKGGGMSAVCSLTAKIYNLRREGTDYGAVSYDSLTHQLSVSPDKSDRRRVVRFDWLIGKTVHLEY